MPRELLDGISIVVPFEVNTTSSFPSTLGMRTSYAVEDVRLETSNIGIVCAEGSRASLLFHCDPRTGELDEQGAEEIIETIVSSVVENLQEQGIFSGAIDKGVESFPGLNL